MTLDEAKRILAEENERLARIKRAEDVCKQARRDEHCAEGKHEFWRMGWSGGPITWQKTCGNCGKGRAP